MWLDSPHLAVSNAHVTDVQLLPVGREGLGTQQALAAGLATWHVEPGLNLDVKPTTCPATKG